MPRNYVTQSKIDQEFNFLVTDQGNHSTYAQLVALEKKNIQAEVGVVLPATYELYRAEIDDSDFILFLLDHATERVVYYVKAAVWEDVVLSKKPVTQVLLWRTNDVIHEMVTTGLARAVFFNYLLKSYSVIASDSHQTMEGREFWIRQTGYALAIGLHVYRYHRLDCTALEITDHATIRDNSCDLWGDDEDYQNVLAIISHEKINL